MNISSLASSFLQRSIENERLPVCGALCAADCECYLVVWKQEQTICNLWRQNVKFYLGKDAHSSVYYKSKPRPKGENEI